MRAGGLIALYEKKRDILIGYNLYIRISLIDFVPH